MMALGGIHVTQTGQWGDQIQHILAQIWEDLPAIPEGTERDQMRQVLRQMEQIAKTCLAQHNTGDED